MSHQGQININGQDIPLEGETNLLSVIRKAGVEMPTFCYHSELSVYGACRLCIVDIEGRGIDTSCSLPPRDGMVVRTHTPKLRKMRKTLIELLLANHDSSCTTCVKSDACRLRDLALSLGVERVPYPKTRESRPPDTLSPALVRHPDKCVLCGDCVRYCHEIQGVGAIDFAYRGEDVIVTPAFNRSLAQVDCISCGQCAAVCPTGAIVPRSETADVWKALADEGKVVVAQIAPAVRAAAGEMFGLPDSPVSLGKVISALRRLGFDEVYDTSFGADLTVLEETHEYLERRANGDSGTMFTSCCPAWVTYAEQFHPELLPDLSSCMSPQGMVGSLAKKLLARNLGRSEADIVMVAIMPCTAKKFEKDRDELTRDGVPLVDHVLTTAELGRLIREAGIVLSDAVPAAGDLPFGLYSESGLGFGGSAGVAEAVARYAARTWTGRDLDAFTPVPAPEGDPWSEAVIGHHGLNLRAAVVSGTKNAEKLIRAIQSGRVAYDLVEVMACPGGCINGGGQPASFRPESRAERRQTLDEARRVTPIHRPEDNPYLQRIYEKLLGGRPGSPEAHGLLHTAYRSRRRIEHDGISLTETGGKPLLDINVCVGTGCFLRGAREILSEITDRFVSAGRDDRIALRATFCTENCSHGPTVTVGDTVLRHATADTVFRTVEAALELPAAVTG